MNKSELLKTTAYVFNDFKQDWKRTYTMRSPVRRTKDSRMCLREEARGKD